MNKFAGALLMNLHKIGAVSTLSGVPTPTLRIWEARYQCFSPLKTASRHRLYSDDDVLKAQIGSKSGRQGGTICLAERGGGDWLS
mgnify:CR=1 FL=1